MRLDGPKQALPAPLWVYREDSEPDPSAAAEPPTHGPSTKARTDSTGEPVMVEEDGALHCMA